MLCKPKEFARDYKKTDISEFESYMASHAVRSLWGGSCAFDPELGQPERENQACWSSADDQDVAARHVFLHAEVGVPDEA